jgi:IclR helix-turn-helix domain
MHSEAKCQTPHKARRSTSRASYSPRCAEPWRDPPITGEDAGIMRRLAVMGCFSAKRPALTAHEIAAVTGVSESTVADDAEYLLRLGYLQRGRRALYRIAEAHLDDWL